MTWRVMIQPDFMLDGIAVTLGDKPPGGRLYVVQPTELVIAARENEAMVTEPSLRLPGDMGRALLDGLAAHYGGAVDARTAREDLLAERKRADKMIDALIVAATRHA